jgi:hypothetical protein
MLVASANAPRRSDAQLSQWFITDYQFGREKNQFFSWSHHRQIGC